MVEINSDDYHDFVIKNGQLIGEFEQMYGKAKDVPWHQDKQEDWLDIRLTIEMLRKYSPFDYICDFGCGLGFFLEILKRKVGTTKSRLFDLDVSPTCCRKAKEIFPNIEFCVFDLMKDDNNNWKISERLAKEKRLFAIRGTLWYVFPEMENVVKNIANNTEKGDYLLVSQNFPPLNSNFVGREVIPNPESIIAWFGKYFTPQKTIWIEDEISNDNDNWFTGIFIRRQQ